MMKVRTLIFATLLVSSCALTGVAQGSVQCALKPAQAPELRGLHLEMSLSQLKARYPKLAVGAADNLGRLIMELTGDVLAGIDSEAFKGVNNLFLFFIDERLVLFKVTYEGLPWKDISQFTEKMSEALKLPGGWSGNDYTQTLSCNGFEVQTGRMSYSLDNVPTYISFKKLDAAGIIKERIDKQKEQQIRAFKP